jgi:hypothetical protein
MNVKKRWERPKNQGNAVDCFQGRLNFSLMDYVRFVDDSENLSCGLKSLFSQKAVQM